MRCRLPGVWGGHGTPPRSEAALGGGGQSNFLASRRAPGVCGGKGGGFVRIDSGALAGRQVTSFTAVLLAM